MRSYVLPAFGLFLGLCGSAGAAPWWEDGSFSQYAPPSGTFTLFDTGERYQAWMIVGQSGNVAFTSGAYVHRGFHFTAQRPGHETTDSWMNLAGFSQSRTGVMQHDVPTTVGTQYVLIFYVGNMYDPGGTYGTSSTVALYANAHALGTFTNSDGEGSTSQNWKRFRVVFTADAPWTSVAFINMDPPGDMDCGLDNVTFKPDPVGK